MLAWNLKCCSDLCFSGVVAHASFRLRNMKNKLENKIEGVRLKRSPMGILLVALGQQEESFQKIQSFLEGNLKEWLDLEKSWHTLFTHVAQRIWKFFSWMYEDFVSLSFQLWTSSVECVQLRVSAQEKLLIWRALTLPQGVCHSTQNLSGHFSFTAPVNVGALLCSLSMFLHTREPFLDLKSVFNQAAMAGPAGLCSAKNLKASVASWLRF